MATYDLTSSIPAASSLAAGDILNCPYSGAKKEITLPKGKYKLEVWGAQGGSYNTSYGVGGKGGYSVGTITLNNESILYLYSGGKGSYGTSTTLTTKNGGGFNGGAGASYYGGAGGGGSDIRIGSDSLYARVIVAGGGGGAYSYSSTYKANGGVGGGSNGANGAYYSSYTTFVGKGGTQTAGGSSNTAVSSGNYNGAAGTFGSGGTSGAASSKYSYSNGAGGGGWYGGSGADCYNSWTATRGAGGGGGSGYVYTSSTASNYPSGCLLNPEYYLADASTAAGNTTITLYEGGTGTGNSGNGACRITVVEIFKDENGSKNLYLKTDAKGSLPSEYIELPYIESNGTQYIDTGLSTPNGFLVETEFTLTNLSLSMTGSIIGSHEASSPYYRNYVGVESNGAVNIGHYNYTLSEGGKVSTGKKYFLSACTIANNLYLNLDNSFILKGADENATRSSKTLYIFNLNGYTTPVLPMKLYNMKIYTDAAKTQLARNYIPALRISDSKAGLYDLVNKVFYPDAAGGNFIYNRNNYIDNNTIYYIKGDSATTNLGKSGTITNSNVVATPNDLLYFNGTNSELKLSTGMTQGTYDFTIDWWEYQTANVNNCAVYGNESRYGCLVGYTYNDKVWSYLSSNNSSWDITGGSGVEMGTVQLNKWVHRACARKGNIIYYFENGKLKNTVTSSASIIYPGTPVIGAYRDSTPHYWQGYLKHFRMSDCARWTSDFTPPSLEMGYGSNYAKITESYIKVPKDQVASFDSNYYPLNYIESSGTQYINTNFIPNQNSSIEIVFENKYFDSIKGFFGGREGTSEKSFSAWINNKTFYPHYGNISYSGFPISTEENINKYNLNKNYANVKETSQIITAATFTSPCSLTLFGVNTNGTVDERRAIGKMYSCKIWDNGTLVRDYVPALRKSDNMAGLYDLVNKVFYTDAAGGNFIYNVLDIDTNTKLLLNGALTDASGNNTIINTNTQIVNTGRVNDTSLYFNGGALVSTNNYNYVSGTNNFTVEWWEYPLAFTSGAAVFQAGTDYGGLLLAYQNGTAGDLRAYAGSNTSTWDIANGITMGTMKLNQWTHRAISRHGNNFYFFENGKLINTTSGSGSINATKQQIGGYTYSGSTKYFQGYIDGFRITQNARWTNDFTPSSKPYGEQWKKIKSIYLKTNNPSGYTRLEYLESTGTQYTDTGLIPNQNTKTVIDCILPTTSSGSYYICGARQESYVGNYSLQTTTGMYYSKHGTADVSLSIPSIDHRMKFIKDGNVFSVDGNLGYNTPVNFTSPNSMYIFACNSAGSIYGLTPCRIYRVQIYQDGINLSRDMVPVLRNSDGKTGFYDLVNSKFYPNLDTTAEFNFVYSNGWEKIT